MMKILNPRVHGYIDYLAVLYFLAAPSLFGFTGLPATIFYVLAAAHLILTLLTAYPLGVVKIIPFPLHGAIELLAGIALVALPWLLGFANSDVLARNIYVASGAVLFVAWLVTDYKTAEISQQVTA